MSDPVDFAAERTKRLPDDTNPSEVSAIDTLVDALRGERERVAAGGTPSDCCIVLVEHTKADGDRELRGLYSGARLANRWDAAEKLIGKALHIMIGATLSQRGID